ncbi:MAG: hypothetical protein ACO2YY_00185 [Pseudohongiellaceae bacterium]
MISNLAFVQHAVRCKEVCEHCCSPYNAPEGLTHSETSALKILYLGEKPALHEECLDLTHKLEVAFVCNVVKIMPPFRKTEISDQKLADIGAYLLPRQR